MAENNGTKAVFTSFSEVNRVPVFAFVVIFNPENCFIIAGQLP